MIDRFVDTWDGFADRFRVPISIVGAGGFAVSCADYAGFVELPEILSFQGILPVVAGGMFNALWWGALYPRVVARRKARDEVQKIDKGSLANG